MPVNALAGLKITTDIVKNVWIKTDFVLTHFKF